MVTREEMWHEREKSLMALIESLEPKLDTVTRDLLKDFVENREYAVAIERLNSYIAEHLVQLSHEQAEEIRRILKLTDVTL